MAYVMSCVRLRYQLARSANMLVTEAITAAAHEARHTLYAAAACNSALYNLHWCMQQVRRSHILTNMWNFFSLHSFFTEFLAAVVSFSKQ